MASLLTHTARLNALHTALQRLDPQSAEALKQHLQACVVAAGVLRQVRRRLVKHTEQTSAETGFASARELMLIDAIDSLIEQPIHPTRTLQANEN